MILKWKQMKLGEQLVEQLRFDVGDIPKGKVVKIALVVGQGWSEIPAGIGLGQHGSNLQSKRVCRVETYWQKSIR